MKGKVVRAEMLSGLENKDGAADIKMSSFSSLFSSLLEQDGQDQVWVHQSVFDILVMKPERPERDV